MTKRPDDLMCCLIGQNLADFLGKVNRNSIRSTCGMNALSKQPRAHSIQSLDCFALIENVQASQVLNVEVDELVFFL